MGQGISVSCKKCGFSEQWIEGIGMRYPSMLEELKEIIIAGKQGAAAKKFLEEHPGATIEARNQIYQCSKCNALQSNVYFRLEDVDSSYKTTFMCGKCKNKK